MISKLKNYLFLIPCYLLLAAPAALARQEGGFGLEETARAGKLIGPGVPSFGPATIAGQVVGYLLAFVGVIFFIFVLYGGFMWMTAAGADEKIKKAISIIRSSLIGLLVIFLSYILTQLVLTRILEATG